MIKHLYIENFILIEKLNLDFENGFSAFVGETGAGKSILIDAISLLCAERGSASYISKGKDKAIIEGTFDFTNNTHALKVLEEAGFTCDDDITLTRELLANGKSVARIDHRIASLSLLKELLSDEIDIHGQRDNQYLLNSNVHVHLLDAYLNNDLLCKEVKDKYYVYKSFVDEKEKAEKEIYNEADLEYFEYQSKEIESADLKVGEDEELEKKEKQYKAIQASYTKLNEIMQAYESLDGDFYDLNKNVQSLEETDELNEIKSQTNDAYYTLNDAMSDLRKFFTSFDVSEEEIDAVEERLFTIQNLKRKYGHSIEDILAYRSELLNKINSMKNKTLYLEEMNKKIDNAYKDYYTSAKKLSDNRRKGKNNLDSEIVAHLKDLCLPNARFSTYMEEAKASPTGIDHVEFLISMNKGEDLKPLNKTASGGELSRLMLGLKVVFTKLQGIQTIIFDEIDTGVSGAVASAIGKKMKDLSLICQVFTVTHLAPVAACADHHYLVKKDSKNDKTMTNVILLNEDETIDELAKISSGSLTEASRNAAKELLERSRS